MTPDDLKLRTKQFGLRVIKLVTALPQSEAGRVLGKQLLRSGTSVGANYRSACRGRSKAEFVSKIGIAEEEADESAFWLELIMESGLMKEALVSPLHDEAEQLRRILAASRISAARPRVTKTE